LTQPQGILLGFGRVLKNLMGRPEARIQIFSETILGKAKRPQIQCLSLKGEF
jgi:hypothetical protein